MARPFFNSSIDELEAEFDRKRADAAFLRTLIDELTYRSKGRAAELRARAVQALGTLRKSAVPVSGQASSGARQAEHRPATPAPATVSGGQMVTAHRPMPPIDNTPTDVLSAWTALEVLSPPSFRRPEDLAGGDRYAVARLDDGRLPWEGVGEKARKNTRLYYQVVLGTVDLEAAVAGLTAVFADARPERPAARGQAVLAVILVDRQGRPIEQPAAAVSSFGWGVPRALSGDLRTLADWRAAERPLVEGLDKEVRRIDPDGRPQPLDAGLLRKAFTWLVSALRLPGDLVRPQSFAIKTYQYYKISEPPEPLLLNSFFLGDLAKAGDLLRHDGATINLKRYLGIVNPEVRRDLLHDRAALAAAIKPALVPPARWPGPGRHPLVLLQQAAVNLALVEPRRPGILAVNGPPGTGKTTLLRDIVAALVTERARAMAGFDDPADAFAHSGEKLKAGSGWTHLYKLDPRVRGFEILVASSNNKAVENVSAELPGSAAVASDAAGLRYFKTAADALLARETWGLIAAVLGKAENRSRFRNIFWWDKDVGLSTYLAAAAGTPQAVQVTDPTTGEVLTRPPRIVTDERAPRDRDEALARWRQARKAFKAALVWSEATLSGLETARVQAERLPELAANETRARDDLQVATITAERAAALSHDADRAAASAQADRDAASADLRRHGDARPTFLARLFRTARFRAWREVEELKQAVARRAAEAAERAGAHAVKLLTQLAQAGSAKVEAAANLRFATDQLAEAVKVVGAARDKLGARFVDAAFFEREHADRHKLAPWLDEAAHRLRDDVFVAALALHKAFVDAAAKPLRHNLGALMDVFGRRPLGSATKEALLPDLWASLFLVVPVASTTFASVERMLGRLPPEALGWLLVDEAGQALPQAVVGALMRTRRAVVVGDPVQIEPVVVLPESLTHAICRRFGVDPDRFDAPAASVQTLADSATPYVAEFAGRQGSRTVGVPLLVHRRCAEPMFGISNVIAYERLMVNAKTPGRSAVRDLLGPSRWFDVEGAAEEKWCPEEGRLVVGLLQQVARAGINPDLYVVTPFVVVQDNLRRLVRESGVLNGWTDDPWAWVKGRVGTVHTVQGREAEAVIFVLGAPTPQQRGARKWAGGRPNLPNVAVTRAKEVLYVVGSRRLWREAGLFRELDARLPPS